MAEPPDAERGPSIETIQAIIDAAKDLEMIYGAWPDAAQVAAHLKLWERHDHPQPGRNWRKTE